MHALATTLLVLVRPRRAFERLRDGQKWVWLAALLLLLATTLVHVSFSIPHIIELQDEVLREQGISFGAEVDTDDPDAAPVLPPGMEENMKTIAVISSYVFGPIALVIGALLLAALFMIVARAWGGEGTFPLAFGMLLLAQMPDAVRALVQSAYTALTGDWVVHQGLSALIAENVSMAAPTPAYALLSMIDIFFIWYLVLLFLGLVVVLKIPRNRALIVVGVYLLLAVALTVIPTALTAAFMPGS